ncbi:MAG: ATP-binding cassette domain-containing protein [Natronospirillum sp.]
MLELKNLTVLLHDDPLFPKVDLTVPTGQLISIMGPSGCGKSTLLAAIAGNLSAVFHLQGDILLDGQSIIRWPASQRRIGLLYQDDLLFPHMNVEQNLAFAIPAEIKGRQRNLRINDVLAHAGLPDAHKRDVATLSGGQRARISLLRTLLAEPRAVLLDEPFSKLDKALREQFRDWVFGELQRSGTTAVLVSHDINDCGNGAVYDLQKGHDLRKDGDLEKGDMR